MGGGMKPELDIVIPVYNEGDNILPVIESLRRSVRTPFRVLICYDREDDNTLPVLRAYQERSTPRAEGREPSAESREPMKIELVRNPARGPLQAILAGFRATTARAVLMIAAD